MFRKMPNKEIVLKNGHTCILRQPRENEDKKILSYLNTVSQETDFLSFGGGGIDLTVKEERNYIREHNESINKLIIIAELEKNIIGIAGFTGGKTKRVQHIGEFGVSVLFKYWGIGIGRALTESLIEWAIITGVIHKINLRVRVDNKRAIILYEHLGFKKEGMITRQFLIGDKFYDAYMMGLCLEDF